MEPISALKSAWHLWRNRKKLTQALALLVALVVAVVVALVIIVVTLVTALTAEEEKNSCGPGGGSGGGSGSPGKPGAPPSEDAVSDIPGNYLEVYREAANKEGIDWAILAAIGKVETDHGRIMNGCAEGPATAYGTAKGPMQFIDSTWASVGIDGNGDGEKNVCDFEDAIPSAAGYLKTNGAPDDYYNAIWGYNNADWYVQKVLDQAETYRAAGGGDGGGGTTSPALALPGLTLPEIPNPLAMRVAHAEEQGWDLVDENRNLHYSDEAGMAGMGEAAAAWDALGSVNVEPTPSPEETDVTIGSAYLGGGTAGVTSTDGTLVVDSAFYDSATENARKALFTHEVGHALRLDHTSQPSVMWNITTNATDNHDTPTEYDKEVYYGIWGREPAPDQGSSSNPLGKGGGGGEGGKGGGTGACPGGGGSGGPSNLPGRKPTDPGNGTAADLMKNPNFQGTQEALDDLQAGIVDERMIATLQAIAKEHQIFIWAFKTGHYLAPGVPEGPTIPPEYSGTAAGAPNTHYFGRAADIEVVDGINLREGGHGSDEPVLDVGRILAGLSPQARPDVIIGPAAWTGTLGYPREAGWIQDADQLAYHEDHLHLGYWSESGTNNTQ